MPALTGSATPVDLGKGYALIAPGRHGRAERIGPAGTALRAARDERTLLDPLVPRVGGAIVDVVEVEATPPPVLQPDDLRQTRAHGALELEVPDLGPRAVQVVLAVHDGTVLTWHFAEGDASGAPALRGAGSSRRFVIPDVPTRAPSARSDRALLGALGRKLLKVLVFPVTDLLLHAPAAFLAEHWESAHRAYRLRSFALADYAEPFTPASALAQADVQRLAAGPALLFLHGTFSTAHGAFADLPAALLGELHRRYEGRVFAFDHFSLSHDPAENARRLRAQLAALAPGADLTVDIVCHSRGGLVARMLEREQALRVRRIVFVATPNAGTVLADPAHMVTMIDRLTSALNLFPPGGAADVLEGVLIAVKIIGHAALGALSGLAAMHPDGAFLRALARPSDGPRAAYFGIASDYDPAGSGLEGLVHGAVDALADRVFLQVGNDLVVPERGVYTVDPCDRFPIPNERCLRLSRSAGVMHTTFFAHSDVADKLRAWLPGAG